MKALSSLKDFDMAESTPRLPVTAEATDYAPYSLLAVLSLGVAVVFALTLLLLAVSAWLGGQQLFEPLLLILPLLALVLAFAGRRQITNSEGTRVGLQFSNAAWWIAIVSGLGFGAYLGGIGYASSRGAQDAFQAWSAPLLKVNPVDLKNVELMTAFHGTLAPEKQVTLDPNDTGKLQSLFRAPYLGFRQSDLVRLAARNRGDLHFEVVGLEEWKNEKNIALQCKLTVKAVGPEGEHTASMSMQKITVKGRSDPTWQIVLPQNEACMFFRGSRLTDYGERIRDMELAAQQLVYSYFVEGFNLHGYPTHLFAEFGRPNPEPEQALVRLKALSNPIAALTGPLAWSLPETGDASASIAQKHFQPLDKGDPQREAEQRKQFLRCYRQGLMGVPGQFLTRSPDVGAILIPQDKAWEIRVPVEMQTTQGDRSQSAARGVVVCRVDEEAFLNELSGLKAKPGELHEAKPRMAPVKAVPWRVVRVESDMKVESVPRGPAPE